MLITPNADTKLQALVLSSLTHIEGIKLLAYPDPVTGSAPWTCGIGNTCKMDGTPFKQGDRLPSLDAARDLCWHTIGLIRPKLHKALKPTVLAALLPREECSLLTWQYNIGSGPMATSTLIRYLNAGDKAAAAEQFLAWDKSKGHVVHGLDNRRAWERGVFLGTINPLVGA